MATAKKRYHLYVLRSRLIGIIGGLLICTAVFFDPVINSDYQGIVFGIGFVFIILGFLDAWYVSSSGKLSKLIDDMKAEEKTSSVKKHPWEEEI